MFTCACIQIYIDMTLHVYIEKLFKYSEGNHKGNFKIKLTRTLRALWL